MIRLILELLGLAPYRADWELPPMYRFARRAGGILRRLREEARP